MSSEIFYKSKKSIFKVRLLDFYQQWDGVEIQAMENIAGMF